MRARPDLRESGAMPPDDRLPPQPLQILRTVFGFPDFRGAQRDVIDHLCAGGDALVLMPTGGGKSLCYQIPALVR
jgi:ATP-dependent DNA helicase RecQ